MIYGYARVSTKGQERNGNSLVDQQEKLRAAGCERIYTDSFTGMKIERPAFSELLSLLQEGDVLVVTKLDRFARTAAEGAQTVQELVNRGVEVNVLNMGKADNSPMGKLMVSIMFSFAEFERDLIVERTTAGKAVARATDPDWHEGRKVKELPQFDEYVAAYERGEKSVSECCRELGIGRSTWYARIRARAVA